MPDSTFEETVPRRSNGRCSTAEINRRRSPPVLGLPLSMIVPRVGSTRPPIALRSVDFPAPFRPSAASTVPS